MSLKRRVSTIKMRSQRLASDAEREHALRLLRRHRDSGRLSADEYDSRAELITLATTSAELRPVFDDLPNVEPTRLQGLGRSEQLLASEVARKRAIANLDRHYSEGRLDSDDHKARVTLAERAKTPAELDTIFHGLPSVGPEPVSPIRRAVGGTPQHLVSDAERRRAMEDLVRHQRAGRLDESTFAQRAELVGRARSPADLRALFTDLPAFASAAALPAPTLRRRSRKLASDAEREHAKDDLRRHHVEGRLDADDFDERLDLVNEAKSPAELRALFRDLPRLGPSRVEAVASGANRALTITLTSIWALINGVATLMWAVAGGGSFWPAVVLVPTTIVLGGLLFGFAKAFSLLRRRR
jgi:hypothetical protein